MSNKEFARVLKMKIGRGVWGFIQRCIVVSSALVHRTRSRDIKWFESEVAKVEVDVRSPRPLQVPWD